MTPTGDGVPILMYHEVSERRVAGFEKYSVTRRAFTSQMQWLASAGHRTIGLDQLLAHRRAHTPVPPRAIVITFDDGFRDCATLAGPIMTSHGFSATFFVVSELMGRTSEWLRHERDVELPIMSWDDARALEHAGHRCESHTATHARLTDVTPENCRAELTRSRTIIEERLGHEVRHLAYPFGAHNEQVRTIAAECGYESACTVSMGLSTSDDPPLELRRVPVLGSDSLLDFISRLGTAHTVSDRIAAFARTLTGRTSTAGRTPR